MNPNCFCNAYHMRGWCSHFSIEDDETPEKDELIQLAAELMSTAARMLEVAAKL